MSNVIVIGGGAAGMMAAVFAAGNGHHVRIYEKNDRLGRKLFITGKGPMQYYKCIGNRRIFPGGSQQSQIFIQCILQFYE